jgi:hypothetical protein
MDVHIGLPKVVLASKVFLAFFSAKLPYIPEFVIGRHKLLVVVEQHNVERHNVELFVDKTS